MKNTSLLCFLSFFLFSFLSSMNNQIALTTIFTPIPLLEIPKVETPPLNFVASIKQASIPITCCFYLGIKKNDIWTDIIQNPLSTSIVIYAITNYYLYRMVERHQQKIDRNIIHMMQHLFHLLIIGHGIYNKIIKTSFKEQKASPVNNPANFNTLELFLCNAYQTWLVLFSYYQEHYAYTTLYAYNMNQIDMFEILQAADQEPDILPLIANFYDKKNITSDYEAIFNYLEMKLKQINHKLKLIMPT